MSARVRPVLIVATLACACRAGGVDPEVRAPLDPLAPGEHGLAIRAGKVLTLDGERRVLDPGLVLVRGDVLAYVGEPVAIPAGYELLDAPDLWVHPGFVDLHTHIHSAGWHDLNDTVTPLNPGLRARATIDPWDERLEHARAAGVTTMFGIPGSGSSLSGFGTVYKPERDAGYEEIIERDPGGLKIAQNFNPQRSAGDLGSSWCGLSFGLEYWNDRVAGRVARGDTTVDDHQFGNLARVHRGELPVLIHCASAEGVADATRMWKLRYGTAAVLSHGCWDGWHAARFTVESDIPVNAGPRVANLTAMQREDRIVGIAAEYVAAGNKLVSLNTDSPVVPEEELFLQGAWSARLGADAYTMLAALTTNPARSFQLGDAVGSLEVGKDADLVLSSGDPLDPRSRIELVIIDGKVQYSRAADGAIF